MQDDWAQRLMLGKLGLSRRQLLLPCVEPLLEHRDVDLAAGHGVDQSADFALQLGDPLAHIVDVTGHPLFFGSRVFMVSLHHRGDDVGREQLALQPGQYALFEALGRDTAAIRAAAARLAIAAAPAILAEHGIGAAAFPTSYQAGKDVLRPPLAMRRDAFVLRVCLLHGIPARLVDDAELLGRHHYHRIGIVRARDTAARLRVLAHLHAVIGNLAGIGRVMEDPVAAAARAGERRRPPHFAARRRHALRVQAADDGDRAIAGDRLGENSPDDRGLFRHDFAVAALDNAVDDLRHCPIAVAHAARHQAALDRAALAAPDLVRELLHEQGVHGPRHADVQHADRPFGQGVQRAIGEGQALVDRVGIAQIAGDAIQGLCHDDLEMPRLDVGEQLVEAGAGGGGAADREILVDLDDVPALTLSVFPAGARLVLGRARVLQVGGEAGVDRGARARRGVGGWFHARVSRAIRRAQHPRLPCLRQWRAPDLKYRTPAPSCDHRHGGGEGQGRQRTIAARVEGAEIDDPLQDPADAGAAGFEIGVAGLGAAGLVAADERTIGGRLELAPFLGAGAGGEQRGDRAPGAQIGGSLALLDLATFDHGGVVFLAKRELLGGHSGQQRERGAGKGRARPVHRDRCMGGAGGHAWALRSA